MNCGAHHASEPVTNATHVNASVDSMNDGLKHDGNVNIIVSFCAFLLCKFMFSDGDLG